MEDPTIIFLHGMGAYSGANAVEMAARFCAARRLRVVAPDLPGYGRSPASVTTTFDPAVIARMVIRQLVDGSGAGPVHVVGHSWGGDLAVFLATDPSARISSVALLDGGLIDWEPASPDVVIEAAREFDRRCRYRCMDDYFAALQQQFRRWTPDLRWAFGQAAETVDGTVRLRQRPEVYAGIRLAGIARPVSSARSALPPTLSLVGADARPDPVALRSPVRHETVPVNGHFLIENAPDLVASRLLDWWADHDAHLGERLEAR